MSPLALRASSSYWFDDIPAALPPDQISNDLDLDPFPQLARTVLEDFGETHLKGDALWRDFLCVTGQVRTFYGS
jgi:hypothetical protein